MSTTLSCPGFVDIQVNGYVGIDYCDPNTSVDKIIESAEILAGRGTAAILGTFITMPKPTMEQCVVNMAAAIKKQGKDSRILGIHIEGPFLSEQDGYRGAHPRDGICDPDIAWFQRLIELAEGHLRLVTVAPERAGAVDFIRAVAPDVLVAAGHTNADFATMQAAAAAGLSLFTHIGNGCRQQIDRHNNIITNAFAIDAIDLCFIADGFHLPEAFLRTLFKCRAPEGLVAVSDAMVFAGCAPGNYNLLGTDIVLTEAGRLQLAADENVMAGSSSDLLTCVNNMLKMELAPPEIIRQVSFENPLRLLGIDPASFRAGDESVFYNTETKLFEKGR